MTMAPLDDRVALVTGGARGIGAAVARELVGAGAVVVVTDVLDQEGEQFAADLGERGFYQHLDVTVAEQWEAVVAAAEQRAGPVSILVNNAGIVEFGGIAEQAPESFRRVLDVNLIGAWLGMHTVLPSMRRVGEGCVVNISSTAGLMGYANLGAYVASKWGLRGLTKAAALELAHDRVRVCSVHPGPIETPMTAEIDHSMADQQPIPRFGTPQEVAAMVRFVITEATYSSGSEFVVDGGAATGVVAEPLG